MSIINIPPPRVLALVRHLVYFGDEMHHTDGVRIMAADCVLDGFDDPGWFDVKTCAELVHEHVEQNIGPVRAGRGLHSITDRYMTYVRVYLAYERNDDWEVQAYADYLTYIRQMPFKNALAVAEKAVKKATTKYCTVHTNWEAKEMAA